MDEQISEKRRNGRLRGMRIFICSRGMWYKSGAAADMVSCGERGQKVCTVSALFGERLLLVNPVRARIHCVGWRCGH